MQLFDIVNVLSHTTSMSGHIVNQDQDVYNGLMQLTGEYQAVSGAVYPELVEGVDPSPTPEVQYGYSVSVRRTASTNFSAGIARCRHEHIEQTRRKAAWSGSEEGSRLAGTPLTSNSKRPDGTCLLRAGSPQGDGLLFLAPGDPAS